MRPSTPPRRSKRVAAGLSILLALTHYSRAAAVDELVKTIPSCAQPCLQKSAEDQGCSLSDYKCQCEADVASLPTCLLTACSINDYVDSTTVLSQICVEVLVGDIGSGNGGFPSISIPSISIPGFAGLPTSTTLDTSPTNDGASDSNDSGADTDTGRTGGSGGSGGGVSRGEIAGIAVGVTLGVLLIVGGVFALIWRRRKAKKPSPASSANPGFPQSLGPAVANTVSDQKSTGTMVSQVSPGGFGSVSPSAASMGTFATYPTQMTPSPGPGMGVSGHTAELQGRNTTAATSVPGSIPGMGMYAAQPAGHNQGAANIHEMGSYMAQPAELGHTATAIPGMGTYYPQPVELSSDPTSVPGRSGN
ncbi:uncharacterized protein DNG_08931 [Cephalotrichum gorgonifer]|uniref:CFEM domain-containing protein n=1 Tax=Cephalotrichum gorgonifer TaxID=2041049 RepID=A0AAE8SZP3_9PEZI|nr:uncharacterized protein DNG_08931 [Cephalotrichum gorgonifer]